MVYCVVQGTVCICTHFFKWLVVGSGLGRGHRQALSVVAEVPLHRAEGEHTHRRAQLPYVTPTTATGHKNHILMGSSALCATLYW